jgi:hypothetical protein
MAHWLSDTWTARERSRRLRATAVSGVSTAAICSSRLCRQGHLRHQRRQRHARNTGEFRFRFLLGLGEPHVAGPGRHELHGRVDGRLGSQPRAGEPAFSGPILSVRLGVRRESAATMSPSLT